MVYLNHTKQGRVRNERLSPRNNPFGHNLAYNLRDACRLRLDGARRRRLGQHGRFLIGGTGTAEAEPSGAETEDPQQPEDTPGDEPAPEDAEVPEAADRQAIVDEAAAQLGVPYKSGGSSPEDGFDSSGFVFYCMNSAGYSFPRQIKKQLEAGERIAYNDLAVGDAVYFSEDEGGEASFCGIYAGGGLLIYSPVPDDFVKTANITTNYWTSRFVTGIRP